MYGYDVHYEDTLSGTGPLGSQITYDLPDNAARLHNISHVANHLMSHILHFYHLVALDYVNPRFIPDWAGGTTGTPTPLNRPFLTPRYDDNYYINTARVGMVAGLLGGGHPAVGAILGLPGAGGGDLGGAVNAYLVGQYLKALDIRRICHQLQGIFAGRAPMCSGYTPGGLTCTFQQAQIDKARELLYAGPSGTGTMDAPAAGTIVKFVGEATDFNNGTAGTMMFDVVAAAHLFPEYFWIGNSWHNFIAWGWGEEAGEVPLSGSMKAIFGNSYTNPDKRAQMRGWKRSAKQNVLGSNPARTVDIMKIGESIANSRYNKSGVFYPDGITKFKHPWDGETDPRPLNEYSWLKSPRYKVGALDTTYLPFEVGPLSRMVVNDFYWAGILSGFYPVTPVWNQAGPNCSPTNIPLLDPLGAALKIVYKKIPPAGRTGGPNLSKIPYNGDSTLDRIAARAIETRLMCDMAAHFLTQLESTIGADEENPGWSTTGCTDPVAPAISQKGYGMSEASRGALSHWIKTDMHGKISLYQAIVPTTWNANPRDANNKMGPIEKSLTGTWVANVKQPIELPRVTHSYDICIACAVHLISPEGEVTKVDIPALPG